jgi:hypothetical protein
MIISVLTAIAALGAQSGQPADQGPKGASPPVQARSALDQAQDNYDSAVELYKSSCGERAYASYDDICGQVAKQIRQYRIDLDKALRAAEDEKIKASTPPKP